MRRIAALTGGGVLAALLLGAIPTPARACVSSQPSFDEAVRGARAIARVTVVEGWDGYQQDPTHTESYRVDRVLKGSLPSLVTVAPAWTTLCHDSVAYLAGDEGAVVVIAFDVPYFDQTIHPMWTVDGTHGVAGTAGVPPAVTSLADLEAAIRSKVGPPDTATPAPAAATTVVAGSSLPLVLAALGGLALAVHRPSRRPGDMCRTADPDDGRMTTCFRVDAAGD